MDTKIKIGVVITDETDRVLLIKEKIKKKPVPLWNTIKGTHGDIQGETIFDTAIRECSEEVSASVKIINALGCYVSKNESETRIQFNFLAKIIEGKPSIPKEEDQLERNEFISEMKWFTKEEILNMSLEEFISERSHSLLIDWINGKIYPTEVYQQIPLK